MYLCKIQILFLDFTLSRTFPISNFLAAPLGVRDSGCRLYYKVLEPKIKIFFYLLVEIKIAGGPWMFLAFLTLPIFIIFILKKYIFPDIFTPFMHNVLKWLDTL